jgi:hypothetical protein
MAQDAAQHQVAFGAVVVPIAQALHHLCDATTSSGWKLDNDLRRCGGSPLPAASNQGDRVLDPPGPCFKRPRMKCTPSREMESGCRAAGRWVEFQVGAGTSCTFAGQVA